MTKLNPNKCQIRGVSKDCDECKEPPALFNEETGERPECVYVYIERMRREGKSTKSSPYQPLSDKFCGK